MTTENQHMDGVELVKELKELDGKILGKFDEITGLYEQANAEIKTLG